jgi:hypothetical protein
MPLRAMAGVGGGAIGDAGGGINENGIIGEEMRGEFGICAATVVPAILIERKACRFFPNVPS